MIKVSIIVPVYNVEQYLEKCLNSLVNQTLKQIEIIIVNDGTKDHSQEIIDRFVNKYPENVFSYKKENGGLSSARNFGIQKAQGEYIAFVDSDDYVDKTMYKKMYEKAKEHSFDLVCCDFNEIREEKVTACSCKIEKDLFTKDEVKESMVDFYPSAWNKIYKCELIRNTGTLFKEGVWFEDVEFIYRLLPYVNSIGVVHENFYQYLIREGSITSSNDMRIYHYVENWNGVLAFYKKAGIYDEYQSILEYCYVRYLFATFIKSACKFDKTEYQNAVRIAFENVNKNFPGYKENKYINKINVKNLYLKYFNELISRVVYFKMHQ